LLNFADLARAVDVDQKTVKAWLSILETSGLLYLLAPWHSNLAKRPVETPKLYVPDTGLCANRRISSSRSQVGASEPERPWGPRSLAGTGLASVSPVVGDA